MSGESQGSAAEGAEHPGDRDPASAAGQKARVGCVFRTKDASPGYFPADPWLIHSASQVFQTIIERSRCSRASPGIP